MSSLDIEIELWCCSIACWSCCLSVLEEVEVGEVIISLSSIDMSEFDSWLAEDFLFCDCRDLDEFEGRPNVSGSSATDEDCCDAGDMDWLVARLPDCLEDGYWL